MDKIFFAKRSLFSSSNNFIQYVFQKYYKFKDITIIRRETGKPFIQGTTNPIFISLSHTDTYIFLAVSNQNIGIDAELKTRKINTSSILKKYPFLLKTTSLEEFLKEWTIRESSSKYLDTPLYSVLSNNSFSHDNEKVHFINEDFFFSNLEIEEHFFTIVKKEKPQLEFIPITTLL